MIQDAQPRVLSVIACGAGPAAAIGTLVRQAQDRGWTVQVIATPAALGFFDQAAIAEQAGSTVRSQYSKPGAPRSQIPHAVIVAPATYNTINKWALGISDTYALGVLAEITGLDVPIVVCPSSTPRSPAARHSSAASNPSAPKESASCSAPAASSPTPRAPAETASPATPGTSPSMKPSTWPAPRLPGADPGAHGSGSAVPHEKPQQRHQ